MLLSRDRSCSHPGRIERGRMAREQRGVQAREEDLRRRGEQAGLENQQMSSPSALENRWFSAKLTMVQLQGDQLQGDENLARTITPTPPPPPPQEDEPFYGWRCIDRVRPDGKVEVERVL